MRMITTLVVAVVLSLTVASPAVADDELSVSSNGSTFGRALGAPLFDPALRWVPGDVRTSTIYVKNNDPFGARLDVDLLGDHMGDLLDSGDLHVTAAAGTGQSFTASDGSATRILRMGSVPGRAVVPVAVTVSFDEGSPNATQLRSTDIRLKITLTQTEFPAPSTDRGGALPDTGSNVPVWLIVLSGCAIVIGAAVARRESPTERKHHG